MLAQKRLLRDFIQDVLYAPDGKGYFNTENHLRNIPQIHFSQLKNKRAYLNALNNTSDCSWFTPSELFKPWFGYIMADHLLARGISVVYEVGAGTGILAENIITRYRDAGCPLEYHTIEISKVFAAVQTQKGLSVHSGSFLDGHIGDSRRCVLMAHEVWDNLPHDCIRVNDYTQCHMSEEGKEHYEPLTDALCIRAVKALEEIHEPCLRGQFLDRWFWRHCFLPTGMLQFLDVRRKCFPNSSLFISDFDKLPTTIEGGLAPIVQTRLHGRTVQMKALRGALKYPCDVFFPVHFPLAVHMLLLDDGPSVKVQKFADFVRISPWIERTQCRNGYNPLVEDFSNYSVLFTE